MMMVVMHRIGICHAFEHRTALINDLACVYQYREAPSQRQMCQERCSLVLGVEVSKPYPLDAACLNDELRRKPAGL